LFRPTRVEFILFAIHTSASTVLKDKGIHHYQTLEFAGSLSFATV
jgi:hypothetical protein